MAWEWGNENNRQRESGPVVADRALTFQVQWEFIDLPHNDISARLSPPAQHNAVGSRRGSVAFLQTVNSIGLGLNLYNDTHLVMLSSRTCDPLHIWNVMAVILYFLLIPAGKPHPPLLPPGGRGWLQNNTQGHLKLGGEYWYSACVLTLLFLLKDCISIQLADLLPIRLSRTASMRFVKEYKLQAGSKVDGIKLVLVSGATTAIWRMQCPWFLSQIQQWMMSPWLHPSFMLSMVTNCLLKVLLVCFFCFFEIRCLPSYDASSFVHGVWLPFTWGFGMLRYIFNNYSLTLKWQGGYLLA